MKKEEVFNFTNKVNLLLKSLEGTNIIGDKYKVNQINKLINEINNTIKSVSPTPYEQYSIKTKYLYYGMINAKNKYESAKLGGNEEIIKDALDDYNKLVSKYNLAKQVRDTFKIADIG
ncbi:IPT/TIG domain containing protein [Clostridium senegalense]|uniref:IPT/TIG domain containing protein n=1 Tax=Clostridium senegalense TaxID=1465809 RepID=UPI001C124EBE|nr:IPT/TIG domain containing protein [Clostridium senegalense]MBU5228152.1 IPT/TIG domain containing protein [Clostridium senegalense]